MSHNYMLEYAMYTVSLANTIKNAREGSSGDNDQPVFIKI